VIVPLGLLAFADNAIGPGANTCAPLAGAVNVTVAASAVAVTTTVIGLELK
jgi:hypothetical protein